MDTPNGAIASGNGNNPWSLVSHAIASWPLTFRLLVIAVGVVGLVAGAAWLVWFLDLQITLGLIEIGRSK